MIFCFDPGVRLGKCLLPFYHQGNCDPLSIFFPYYRTMVAVACRDFSFLQLLTFFVFQGNHFFLKRSPFITEFIMVFSVYFFHGQGIVVNRICPAGGVHPSIVFIETLIDKKLSPGNSTISIKSFFTDHMHFGTEIKGGMWIDQ